MEAVTELRLVERLLDPRVSIPVIVARDGIVTSWNDAARELFDGDVGRPVEELFAPGSRSKLEDTLAAAPGSCEVQSWGGQSDPETLQVVAIELAPDMRLLFVNRVGVRYSEAMEHVLLQANRHLANLTREVSRQSAELEAARNRFEALAEQRERFIAMLAHDVRGALNNILLSVEVILGAGENVPFALMSKALGSISRSSTRVAQLVDTVLESARTETGRIVLDAALVSIREVAQGAIETYDLTATRAGVRLELVDQLGDAVVSGDRVRLGQIAGNLIENAIRYSPHGGRVTVELSGTPQTVRLTVRDEGPGIPAEQREQIFERFVQGPGTSGSLGLGLCVAHELVGLHGGRIFVEDVVPSGTALVVELPRVG